MPSPEARGSGRSFGVCDCGGGVPSSLSSNCTDAFREGNPSRDGLGECLVAAALLPKAPKLEVVGTLPNPKLALLYDPKAAPGFGLVPAGGGDLRRFSDETDGDRERLLSGGVGDLGCEDLNKMGAVDTGSGDVARFGAGAVEEPKMDGTLGATAANGDEFAINDPKPDANDFVG